MTEHEKIAHLLMRTGIAMNQATTAARALIEAGYKQIVKCKNCSYRGREECAMFYRCNSGEQHTWETDNDFCSYGEPIPVRIQAVGKKALCRSCGAPILWIKTPAGKSMPCDDAPVYYRNAEKGPDKVVTLNGVTVSCEIIANSDEADGFGYIPHWSTCDKPDEFRKR